MTGGIRLLGKIALHSGHVVAADSAVKATVDAVSARMRAMSAPRNARDEAEPVEVELFIATLRAFGHWVVVTHG
jgi:hypothetical protein